MVRGTPALAGIAAALVLLLVHVTLLGRHAPWAGTLADSVLALLQGTAFFAMLARRRHSSGEARQIWLLLAAAILLQLLSNVSGLAASAVRGDIAHRMLMLSALLSGLYIAPLMYLIARTFSRDMTRLVHVVDSVMVAFVAVLLVALVYYVDTTPHHIMLQHIGELAFLSDAVNYSLAILVTIRMSAAATGMRRHAYLAAATFLWLHVLGTSGLNRIGQETTAWWLHTLLDSAYVAVVVMALGTAPRWLRRLRPEPHTSTVVDGFAPIVMTISVLALGISVSRLNFGIGMIVSVLSVLFYGLRMAYIQSRDRDRQLKVTLSNQRLQEQLGTDPLTGIANRMTLDMRLPSMLSASRTSKSPLSVLMVDIDFFKQYNDHFGHLAGDRCLVEVVNGLRKGLLRAGDLLARYGGEEFVVVLPDTSERAAMMVAERLVARIGECQIPHPESPYRRVTVSIGVATAESGFAGHSNALLNAADNALYGAKHGGRNRTHLAASHGQGWVTPSAGPDGKSIVRH